MTNMRPPSRSTLLKVVILGDGGVGKSCLMNRFVSNRYDCENFQTIGVEFMNKDIDVDGDKYTLQIWDTAGQERFRALRTPFYRGSDVCLLCYSIDDYDSFRGLKQWRQEFIAYADVNADKFPFIVVGNKNDLPTKYRQVTANEVKEWCDNYNIPTYIETSSKAAINVTDAFVLAVCQWKHMERIAEIELKQNDTIDLTNSIRLAQTSCCTGSRAASAGGIESEDDSMSTPSPRRFGRHSHKPQQTNFQL